MKTFSASAFPTIRSLRDFGERCLALHPLVSRRRCVRPGCPVAAPPWLTGRHEFDRRLTTIRTWYNHDRPHDHLQGQTPAEVWAGIDVFAPRTRVSPLRTDRRQESG
jgi:transposase InsO family protein